MAASYPEQRRRPVALLALRISSDRTGEELGVSRQREDGRGLIERRDWEFWGEIVENDVSAAGKRRRIDFEKLLEVVRSGAIDVVVAWALDRLTRNSRDRLALLEACRDAGVMLAFVRGSDIDPTTPAGRLTFGILGEVAQHEIDQKSDRQKRAAIQAAQKGRRIGGRRPFGYDDDGMGVRDDEKAVIVSSYRDLLDGVSLSQIARDWNETGLRSGQRSYREKTRGQPVKWDRTTVRKVLENPRNAGIRTHLGQEVGQAIWPALVDIETFRAAVSVLNAPARHTGAHRSAQLLTGLALCGVCGETVHGGGSVRRQQMYRCRSMRHVNRLRAPVDEYVIRIVVGYLSRHAADVLVARERPDIAGLRDEAVVLRARLDSLATEFADGVLTSSQLRAATERLRGLLADVEARQADAGRQTVLAPFLGADVEAAWEGIDIDRRRAVIDTLAVVQLHPPGRGTRTFRPETVTVTWRSPVG